MTTIRSGSKISGALGWIEYDSATDTLTMSNGTTTLTIERETAAGVSAMIAALRGAANGIAPLGADGLIPAQHISQTVSSQVVANIAARDAIASPAEAMMVTVLDASADTTVTAGAATYIRSSGAWVKIAEVESMDLVVTWDNLTGKPEAFPPATHTHATADVTGLDAALAGKLTTPTGGTTGDVLTLGADGNYTPATPAASGGMTDAERARLLPTATAAGRIAVTAGDAPPYNDNNTRVSLLCDALPLQNGAVGKGSIQDSEFLTAGATVDETTAPPYLQKSIALDGTATTGYGIKIPYSGTQFKSQPTRLEFWFLSKTQSASYRMPFDFNTYPMIMYTATSATSAYFEIGNVNNIVNTVIAGWNHVVLSWDGTSLRWFLNGTRVYTGNTAISGEFMSIGSSTEYPDRAANINVADIRIITGDQSAYAGDSCPIPSSPLGNAGNIAWVEATPDDALPGRLLPASPVIGSMAVFEGVTTGDGRNNAKTKLLLPLTSDFSDTAVGSVSAAVTSAGAVAIAPGTGKFGGGAARFTGDAADQIKVAYPTALLTAQTCKISFWFRLANGIPADNRYIFISKDAFTRYDSMILLSFLDGKVLIFSGMSYAYPSNVYPTLWNFVEFIYQDGNWYAYLNGKQACYEVGSLAASDYLCFGRTVYEGANSLVFDGWLSDILIEQGGDYSAEIGATHAIPDAPATPFVTTGQWVPKPPAEVAALLPPAPWTTLDYASAVTVPEDAPQQKMTLTGNCALTAPTLADGQRVLLKITGTGQTLTYDSTQYTINGKCLIGWYHDGETQDCMPLREVK